MYPEQVFVVLHGPQQGARGHVHYVELGPVHRPELANHRAWADEPGRAVGRSVCGDRGDHPPTEDGRLGPSRPCELSAALVGVLTGRLRDFLTELTQDVWRLERQVTAGHMGNPENFLEELFGVRHGLQAVRTNGCHEPRRVYGRMSRLSVFGPSGAAGLDDLEDQFRRIAAMADSQREYLQGVIEFYRTRTQAGRGAKSFPLVTGWFRGVDAAQGR